jgi:hypothetical protein
VYLSISSHFKASSPSRLSVTKDWLSNGTYTSTLSNPNKSRFLEIKTKYTGI